MSHILFSFFKKKVCRVYKHGLTWRWFLVSGSLINFSMTLPSSQVKDFFGYVIILGKELSGLLFCDWL